MAELLTDEERACLREECERSPGNVRACRADHAIALLTERLALIAERDRLLDEMERLRADIAACAICDGPGPLEPGHRYCTTCAYGESSPFVQQDKEIARLRAELIETLADNRRQMCALMMSGDSANAINERRRIHDELALLHKERDDLRRIAEQLIAEREIQRERAEEAERERDEARETLVDVVLYNDADWNPELKALRKLAEAARQRQNASSHDMRSCSGCAECVEAEALVEVDRVTGENS